MAIDIVIPTVAESVTSGVIARWNKGDGEAVQRDGTVLELETDKVTMEVPAPAAGIVKQSVAVGATVQIGQVVGSIDPAGAAAKAVVASASTGRGAAAPDLKVKESTAADVASSVGRAAVGANGHGNDDVRATPLARKLASEHNVDISRIAGTGPGKQLQRPSTIRAQP